MRLRRSRKGTLLAAVIGLSLVAAACGDDDDTESAATSAAAETSAPSTETTAAAETTASETTAPSGETTAPTAPARGDADLVIWADDTRTPVLKPIAETFGQE